MSGRIGAIVIGVTLVVLRAPSLIEPPQFSDEGTYANIGFALDHGAVLYRDVWDNKPPGVYWLAALINLVQRSVTAYHIVVAIAVVVMSAALGVRAQLAHSGGAIRHPGRRVQGGSESRGSPARRPSGHSAGDFFEVDLLTAGASSFLHDGDYREQISPPGLMYWLAPGTR
jgi:hypothetical protein